MINRILITSSKVTSLLSQNFMGKNILTLLGVSFVWSTMLAQPTRQQAIEESELGWYKVYHFKGAKESKKVDNRVFSLAQLSICDSLANWMQASYLPKGGIGDVKKEIFPKANQYSPYNAALPQGYGATTYVWNVSYNKEGKLERVPETETAWRMSANGVPGWPIPALSTTTEYYFTMPSFEVISSGTEEVKKEQDLSQVQNLKPFPTFWIKSVEAGNGTEHVLLCKENKSPFIKLTKGEYLRLLETAIPRAYEMEKKSIHEKNSGNQKSIDYFMKYLDEKNTKRMVCLKNSKEKHQDRLHETAEVFSAQPDILLENYPDVFDGTGASVNRYPVYTLEPSMYELCKKDNPQWILASWDWSASQPKEKHMHESIINNFNFNYVYNFFFFPEKVKGQPYRPLHSPALKETVIATEKSETGKKTSLDAGVHFFEDFSTTGAGKKPIGWYAKTNHNGIAPIVTTIDGAENNWAILAGNSLIPNNLKKPFPSNFTFSYDVSVPENFTWGAKGLVVLLAKQKTEGVSEAFIKFKTTAGLGRSKWGGHT
jgi:hypothetical protein